MSNLPVKIMSPDVNEILFEFTRCKSKSKEVWCNEKCQRMILKSKKKDFLKGNCIMSETIIKIKKMKTTIFILRTVWSHDQIVNMIIKSIFTYFHHNGFVQ